LVVKQGAAHRAQTRYNVAVARIHGLWLLAFALVGGVACADVDETPADSGVRSDAQAWNLDAPPASASTCVYQAPIDIVPTKADILILLDRSGSMDTVFGNATRYQALTAELSDLVSTYAVHVRFGYQEMPSQQACAVPVVDGCCATQPSVPVTENNAGPITAAFAAAAPMEGNTPTAAALRAAREYYDDLADGIGNRYVLLATDGAPNCTLAGSLSAHDTFDASGNRVAGACFEALAEIDALVGQGMTVIVLGLGDEFADTNSDAASCLSAMAEHGGAAATPTGRSYYVVSEPLELQIAIEQIFGGIKRPSCTVPLSSDFDFSSSVTVFLDGQFIPNTLAGSTWSLDTSTSPPSVKVQGEYCDRLQRFEVDNIKVVFGCKNTGCTDAVGCPPSSVLPY
jgi:hypothetical protein